MMARMRLLLASANHHKRRELSEIMSRHRLSTPDDYEVVFEYEETAETFMGNALGKAQALHGLIEQRHGDHNLVVIADDSGICVDALDGGPGVRSARFGSAPGQPELDDEGRNQLLLEKLRGVENRSARYVCCMVAYLGIDRYFMVQETWHGVIAERASDGTGGFGYDPVFYLPDLGVTVAEISAEEKHHRSHRGTAARRLAAVLNTL